MISSADRSTGNHAYGFAAATSVNGANSSPSSRRYSSSPIAAGAPRRALSKMANVSHAWNTSCATSAGWNGASHGNGRFSSGLNEYG